VSEDHAMHRAPERVRMTYDDLLALPDDGDPDPSIFELP
jgi:hypothetical protein